MEDLPPLFAAGQRLGRYELLQRLAVGGMAEVYLAYAVGPGDFRKVVAIKRLLPQHALDPQLLRMFLDEARLMARLSHPHIPQVTDVDDGAGKDVPYFVMEYIHGTDLRGVLNAAAGPLPFEHALAITSAVAAGLHHAHEHRGGGGQRMEIVHRDVSPSNILISFAGGVKITDFGVAKWIEQKSFTHQGQLKGKFAHMSPEQCRGEALDRRSDVFALGTLLYEMTTGQPPFVAESEYELLTQIVSQDVAPPRRHGAPLPPPLAAIVMKSLRRDRGDRYASAQDLQLDLEAFAREHKMVVSPVALAEYLESLFGAQVTAWREALASGRTLADHLDSSGVRVGTASVIGRGKSPAPERTATDTFARLPGATRAENAAVKSTLRATKESAVVAAPPDAVPRRGRVTRTVAMGALTATALAVVLVAIEMTSQWQRASQARLPPPPLLESTTGFARPKDSSIGSAARPTVSAAAAVPANQLLQLPTAELVPAAGAASPKAAASAPRRGRETLRLARREAPVGNPIVPMARLNEQPARTDAARNPPLETPASSGVARGGDIPPTPVKVWDPDSPVPP